MTLMNNAVAYDAERNILIEPSQEGAIPVLTDKNNQPLILYTLGYKDIYEIVGLYQLVRAEKSYKMNFGVYYRQKQ